MQIFQTSNKLDLLILSYNRLNLGKIIEKLKINNILPRCNGFSDITI